MCVYVRVGVCVLCIAENESIARRVVALQQLRKFLHSKIIAALLKILVKYD